MKKSAKMVEEITKKRKMTQAVKDTIKQRIFQNSLLAIGVILYFLVINAVYLYTKPEISTIAMKVFSIIFIIVTVITFEIAYRKDSGKIAIVGIEFLMVSVIVLCIPKIYANLDKVFCAQMTFIPIFFGMYYMVKSIVIYVKTEKVYQNNLSDVKEIIKED